MKQKRSIEMWKMGVRYFACPVYDDAHAVAVFTRWFNATRGEPTDADVAGFMGGTAFTRWGRRIVLVREGQMELGI